MRSKAAVGTHPIHPALVPIPIGAFALTLIGDIAHAVTKAPFWYAFAQVCMGIGIVTALVAAVAGLVDYLGVKMNARSRQLATIHLAVNVSAVLLYVLNWLLRMNDGALLNERWPLVFALEIVTFLGLGVSGWIGGSLSYEHHVGVVEGSDLETTLPEAPRPTV
jgi:uncharacterized membrane protein